MTQNILVAVDGSATSERAVQMAQRQAKAFAAQTTAVYVIDPYPFTGVGAEAGYGQAQYLAAAAAEANEALAGVRKAFEAQGLPIVTEVVEAHSIWRGILDAAAQAKADLIVIGSHGRSGIEKFVLGSVAQRVVSHAHTPVLVVRD